MWVALKQEKPTQTSGLCHLAENASNLQFCWRRLTPLPGTPQLDYRLQICDSGYYDIPIPHHWLHQNPQFVVVVRFDKHKM